MDNKFIDFIIRQLSVQDFSDLFYNSINSTNKQDEYPLIFNSQTLQFIFLNVSKNNIEKMKATPKENNIIIGYFKIDDFDDYHDKIKSLINEWNNKRQP